MINMEKILDIQSEKRARGLIRVYHVHHKDDPEKKVRLRTIQNLTACQVKEKIVRNGMFDRSVISELRVERLNR